LHCSHLAFEPAKTPLQRTVAGFSLGRSVGRTPFHYTIPKFGYSILRSNPLPCFFRRSCRATRAGSSPSPSRHTGNDDQRLILIDLALTPVSVPLYFEVIDFTTLSVSLRPLGLVSLGPLDTGYDGVYAPWSEDSLALRNLLADKSLLLRL
jgi:hypothetical protein